MSCPVLEQCGNGRAEFIEEITQRKALLCVERNISHAAAFYGAPERLIRGHLRAVIIARQEAS